MKLKIFPNTSGIHLWKCLPEERVTMTKLFLTDVYLTCS